MDLRVGLVEHRSTRNATSLGGKEMCRESGRMEQAVGVVPQEFEAILQAQAWQESEEEGR